MLIFNLTLVPPDGTPEEARLYLQTENISFEYDDQASYTGSTYGFWVLPENAEAILPWLDIPGYGEVVVNDEGCTIRDTPVPAEIAVWARGWEADPENDGYENYWEGLGEYDGPLPKNIYGIEQFNGTYPEWELLIEHPLVTVVS
jgi:hypothetical protein